MPVNGQYSDPPFGLGGDYASTNAPGSEGVTAAQSSGVVVGSPVVASGWDSSQLPLPRVAVMAGDTCSSSADGPVPPGGDPLSGLSLDTLTSTGAGRGSPRNLSPNASGVPGMGAQVQAARSPS